jgi:hypothetical protein
MAIRFIDVDQDVLDLIREVQAEHFPELRNVKIKYLFDTKKRMSNGKVVIGRCQRTNEIIKHLTVDEAGDEEGYQYLISFDYEAYSAITRTDRIRLIRHELRHVLVDEEARQPYKINPHNVEDFMEEIELNTDDVRWAERVASLAEQIYSQHRDEAEDEE